MKRVAALFENLTDPCVMESVRVRELLTRLRWKHPPTCAHALRVGALCRVMARRVGLSAAQQEFLYQAGVLHDVGKLMLDNRLLDDGARFDDAQKLAVRRHADAGDRIVRAAAPDGGGLLPLAAAVRHHHEAPDGSGYPDGLRGAEIPAASGWIAVADAFDAMMTRTYNGKNNKRQALREIRSRAGGQFDAEAAALFIEIM